MTATTSPKTDTALAFATALRFGVEIETLGHRPTTVAKRLASALTRAGFPAEAYDTTVRMGDGRAWRCIEDGSIRGNDGRNTRTDCEVVSPILGTPDMALLGCAVKAIRGMGSGHNASCGIHVHVSAAGLDTAALVRLNNLVANYDKTFDAALGISSRRRGFYVKPQCTVRSARLNALPAGADREAFATAFFGSPDNQYQRTSKGSCRYHGLNLHSVFLHGTVEFRLFQPSLSSAEDVFEGEVTAYVWLCLGMVGRAATAKSVKLGCDPAAVCPGTPEQKTAQAMRDLFWRCGLTGPAFQVVRAHLTARTVSAKAPAKARAKAGLATVVTLEKVQAAAV